MFVALIIALVWVAVAATIHWRRREYYRKRHWAWNQRMHGLLSFNDRQVYWMTNLWPLTLVATILYILMCWGCSMIEWFTELKKT